MSEADSIWDVPLVVSCYEGVYRTGPVPLGVPHGYDVHKDGARFHYDLPRLLGAERMTWGYSGTGTRALAFALLADEFGAAVAWHYYDPFRDAVIARLPQLPHDEPRDRVTEHILWSLSSRDVRAWMLTATPPAQITADVPVEAWEWPRANLVQARVTAEFYPGRRVVADVARTLADEHADLYVVRMQVQRWRMWSGFGAGGWEAEPPGAGPVPAVQWHPTFPTRRRWTGEAGA